MKTLFNSAALIALSVLLSGCISVMCDDGPLRDRDGNEVKVNTLEERDQALALCPRTATEDGSLTTPPPPAGPAPTNLAPAAGLAVFGAALLGGGGNNGTPVTATTGTK